MSPLDPFTRIGPPCCKHCGCYHYGECPSKNRPELPDRLKKTLGNFHRLAERDELIRVKDARIEELEARMQAIIDYEPSVVCVDEFAFDRMVDGFKDVARKALEHEARKEHEG